MIPDRTRASRAHDLAPLYGRTGHVTMRVSAPLRPLRLPGRGNADPAISRGNALAAGAQTARVPHQDGALRVSWTEDDGAA